MDTNSGSAPKKRGRKFLLWGAIAAFLGAIIVVLLIPPYGDYTPRAKVAEVFLTLSGIRNEVTSFYEKHQRLPRKASEANISLSASGYIRELTYDGAKGELRAVIQDIPGNEGKTLVFKAEPSGGKLNWRCFSDDIPTRDIPRACRKD